MKKLYFSFLTVVLFTLGCEKPFGDVPYQTFTVTDVSGVEHKDLITGDSDLKKFWDRNGNIIIFDDWQAMKKGKMVKANDFFTRAEKYEPTN